MPRSFRPAAPTIGRTLIQPPELDRPFLLLPLTHLTAVQATFSRHQEDSLWSVPGVGPAGSRHPTCCRLRRCGWQTIDCRPFRRNIVPAPVDHPQPPTSIRLMLHRFSLFAGSLLRSDELPVAIVVPGSPPSGRKQAEKIAYGLAKAGVTVVVAKHRGIDTAAHHKHLTADARSLLRLWVSAYLSPPENGGGGMTNRREWRSGQRVCA